MTQDELCGLFDLTTYKARLEEQAKAYDGLDLKRYWVKQLRSHDELHKWLWRKMDDAKQGLTDEGGGDND